MPLIGFLPTGLANTCQKVMISFMPTFPNDSVCDMPCMGRLGVGALDFESVVISLIDCDFRERFTGSVLIGFRFWEKPTKC